MGPLKGQLEIQPRKRTAPIASDEEPVAMVLVERSEYLQKLSEDLRERLKKEREYRIRIYEGSRELSDASSRLRNRISGNKFWQFRKTTHRARSSSFIARISCACCLDE